MGVRAEADARGGREWHGLDHMNIESKTPKNEYTTYDIWDTHHSHLLSHEALEEGDGELVGRRHHGITA